MAVNKSKPDILRKRVIGVIIVLILEVIILSGCSKKNMEADSKQNPENTQVLEELPQSSEEALETKDSHATEDVQTIELSATDNMSDLQKYRYMYEQGNLILDELDDLRADLRFAAANPYENQILEEYLEKYNYNDRTIGYIHIDDTVIDAPVLQTLEDYEYYLHRDIDGNPSEPGCIILDADSEIGIGTVAAGYLEEYEPSPIQLVHGHNMRNGTMFGSLLKYADKSYGQAHNIINYDSLYEKRKYELVCAFYSQIYPEDEDVFKYYDIEGIDTSQEAFDWFAKVQELALYQTDVIIEPEDELIVLSTCSYHTEEGRFAVVGRRIRE